MAVIISNILRNNKKFEIPEDISNYKDKYNDNTKIKNYAQDSVAIASKYAILNGRTGNLFEPTQNTTRAEAATVIYKMLYSGML